MSLTNFQRQFTAEPVALVPGTLRGYRSWKVTLEMGLVSVSHDYVWPPTLEATCARSGVHLVPDPNCSCGIYACHQPDDEQVRGRSELHPGSTVTGVIEAWGRVQLGARGFRAQHARVVALEFALPTHARYGASRRNDIFGVFETRYELPDGRIVKESELHRHWNDPKDWQLMLMRHYRGVRIFRDREAMLAAYPPIDVSGLAPRK